MIHTTKNIKWIIFASLLSVSLGVLTFFTFINQGFIKLDSDKLQILLFLDLFVLVLFFLFIFYRTFQILKEKKKGKIGSETSFKYLTFFSLTTLIPSVLIAIFSLFLFNVVIQKYFEKKIKSIVNNSSVVARNYVNQTRSSIETDILLMTLDVNRKSSLYYDNPKGFLDILMTQRLLRRLDEVYLLDSAGNVLMSNVINTSTNFFPPPEEAFVKSLDGKPVEIPDSTSNKTSALVKLDNFIDTYLYIVRYVDPKIINYLKETDQAVSFYYGIQNRKTGIKVTFGIIYVLIVSLLLFLSIVISINFVSRFMRPIINLIQASEEISSGNLNAKVPIIQTDKELEKLNENFNSMIEKLKKQQDKLLLIERHTAWESVARKLAHEIKNPLTPIQLSIDIIKEKYLDKLKGDKEKFSDYLNTITKQIQDIEHLVTEFSDFARMPKPIFKKINLNDVASRALILHEPSEPSIIFKLSKSKSFFSIKGDEEQLNRVFINLVKNSIDSIHEKKNKMLNYKGKISLDIRDDNVYIYVILSDNGIGFDHIDKAKMLTPYFTTKKKGTGLGLAIVNKIISDHNGSISFNSTRIGGEVKIIIPK